MANPNIPIRTKKEISGAAVKTAYTDGNANYKDTSLLKDSEDNKYNIKKFMYPEDLDTSKEYGRHMVVFYINVNSTPNKNIAKPDGSYDSKTYKIPQEDNKENGAQRLGIDSALAAIGLGAGKLMRLDTAIALHMPNSVKTGYSVQWQSQNDEGFKNADLYLSSAAKALADAKAAPNVLAAIGQGAASAMSSAKDIVAARGSLSIIKGMFGEGAAKYAEKTARVTEANAKEEQTFEGVDFRTFNFSYTFAPKSPSEAENILYIIRMLRHHMLPEFSSPTNFMYIYPSEFNIKYYSGTENGFFKENEFIEKISTCVLTNLEVDYTPNGEFSSFKNTDPNAATGMPTHINLTMTFKELGKVSKETSPWEMAGL